LWYAVSFALQLGFLIVIPVGGFILLGHWADTRLHSSPALLVAGIIAGLFATVLEVYHLIAPLTGRHHD
jgi:F0F1-type ATP synthase assembly protein I